MDALLKFTLRNLVLK